MLNKLKQALENQNIKESITAMGSDAAMQLDSVTEMLDDAQNSAGQKFADFMNNHPNLTGLIVWLVMILNTIGSLGSIAGKQDKDVDMDLIVKQIIEEIQEETESTDNSPDPENSKRNHARMAKKAPAKVVGPHSGAKEYTIDPIDEKLLDEIEGDVLCLIPEFETFIEPDEDGTFHVNVGESRCTIGYGNTWLDIREGDVVYRYACTKNTPEGAKKLVAEIKKHYKSNDRKYFLDRAKLHMLIETLPALKKVLKDKGLPAPEKLPRHQLAALLIAGYQMKSDMISIVQRLAKAKTDEDKINAFSWTWASKGNVDGTFARRYWLGLLYTGKITIEELLSFPIDGFNKINRPKGSKDTSSYVVENSRQNIARKKGTIHGCKFKVTKEDIEKNIKIVKNGATKETVTQHLKKHGLNYTRNRSKSKPTEKAVTKQDTKTNQSEESVFTRVAKKIKEAISDAPDVNSMMKSAKSAYDKGNYEEAAKLYSAVIANDKDNLEAYSSLVLVYKQLGDKAKGTAAGTHYEQSCDIARQGLERIKQNRNLGSDVRAKASIYYNAGLAREGMAEVYQQQKNTNKAREQYNKAKINHNNAYEAIKGKDNKKAEEYKIAKNRVEQKLNGLKKFVFNSASDKINTLMSGKENKDALKFFETDTKQI